MRRAALRPGSGTVENGDCQPMRIYDQGFSVATIIFIGWHAPFSTVPDLGRRERLGDLIARRW